MHLILISKSTRFYSAVKKNRSNQYINIDHIILLHVNIVYTMKYADLVITGEICVKTN